MADLLPESFAARIMVTAVKEGRAAELLACLFDGGSATVDPDGRLCLASAAMLDDLMRGTE